MKKYYTGKNPDERPFTCKVCGNLVTPDGAGTEHRNHCPHCLASLHLDDIPGDRAAGCGGIMDPVGVWVRKGGEWAIIHRCRRCGHLSSNRTAADDNPVALLSLAAKPLASPPFPLHLMERMAKETLNQDFSLPKAGEKPHEYVSEKQDSQMNQGFPKELDGMKGGCEDEN